LSHVGAVAIVKEAREVVELANRERDERRQPSRVDRDERRVNALSGERFRYIAPERVAADPAD
jgi:hypothetical protein